MNYEQKDILRAFEAQVRATIDDMLDNPGNYFSLEGMEDEVPTLDRDLVRNYVASRLAAGPEMV